MNKNDFISIKNTLLQYVLEKVALSPNDKLMDESHCEVNLITDFLSVTITSDEMTVFYANEHDEFIKETYSSEEKWIKSVGEFIVMLSTKTVSADYFYNRKNNKLLSYKIWAVNANHQRRMIKSVSLSANPFVCFQRKEIITKTLHEI